MRHQRFQIGLRLEGLIRLLLLCLLLWQGLAILVAQPTANLPQPSQTNILSETSEGGARFLAVHGRRSVVMGYSTQGLEVWGYPFQLLTGYRVGFRPVGSATATDGLALLRRIDFRPDATTRTYIGPDFLVRETIFVPLDKPGAVFTYEVEGARQVDVVVQFQPVMNLMWPGAVGGQYTRWSDDVPGYLITEPEHGFSAAIGSPDTISHDDTVNSTIRQQTSFSFVVRPRTSTRQAASASVYLVLNQPDATTPASALHDLVASHGRQVEEAATHYADLLGHSLQLETPDPEVNHAVAWSEVALDQAWVCDPRVGCGIVAGYGPSRDARRPQYAWFFAGDGLIATNALIAAGEYTRARDELNFIARYQQPQTGMIWHELSQSAGWIDWSKYPYMYVHVDITADYLAAVAHYVEASGDVEFARQHWTSILQAHQYCRSLIRDTDHLPHIPPDKEGGDEQARPGDDLALSAGVLSADTAFGSLANLTGRGESAPQALSEAALLRQAIASRYWDQQARFWIDGHTQTGSTIQSRRRGPVQLIPGGPFSAEQNDSLLRQLASSDFRTDWGMREVALSSPDFDPYSYGRGSVSAPATAQAATAFWSAHRPEIGLSIWRDLLQWNRLDTPGHMHEVLAGNYFHEQTESVPEQTWSSAGFLSATISGLLGLRIDGTNRSIHFAPHLPPEWDHVTVSNISLPRSTLKFALSQTMTSVDLKIEDQGDPVSLTFEPQLPLGANLIRAECDGRKLSARVLTLDEEEQATLSLLIPSGASQCHLQFAGGISIVERRPALHVGDPSTRLKITSLTLRDRTLSIESDVAPQSGATILLRTSWKLVASQGATSRMLPNGDLELTIPPPKPMDGSGFVHVLSSLTFAAP